MTTTTDYREFLTKALEDRHARNSKYSLRAFARDLGISVASLSLILAGKQGISKAVAKKIAKRLGMHEEEKRFFCDLVESEHARGARQKELARIRLQQYSREQSLTLDTFQVMSDWYYFAILELTMIDGFVSSPAWIAKSLGISISVTEAAIERLKRLELLEEVDGILCQTGGFMATPSDVPSEALKKFHSQLLHKAQKAIYDQSVEERDISSITLPIQVCDIPWAKQQIKEFRRGLMAKLESAEKKDAVYCLAVQFFGVQEKEVQKGNEV